MLFNTVNLAIKSLLVKVHSVAILPVTYTGTLSLNLLILFIRLCIPCHSQN